ncbi:DUF6503 family protein [Thalassobellus citreus]|uniref:DUF6503 family protein n=1 Tax=Thalassobellus citreus TaxID=3367752 RepID=UPI0037985DB7
MKNIILSVLLIVLVACKQSKATKIEDVQSTKVEVKNYPETISKVFKTHGGLNVWNTMKTLSFAIPKPDGKEITTVNLKNRKSRIDMSKHILGFDGKDVWLHKKDTIGYNGDAKFYYNLMFYFYAMPFVLADNGIHYETAKALEFDGKQYPGIKISYESGVGESSDDEYIMYYNPETYQMAWLGYTVTYFSKEKSKDFHYIKYNDWQRINGVLLPKTIQWYNVVNGKITDKQNDVDFVDVMLSKENPDSTIFAKPEKAEIIE